METYLEPCPFCGGGAEVYPDESDAGYYVACFQPQWPVTECFCALGEEYDRDAMPEHRFKTKAEAIAAWNTRVSSSADIRTQALEEAAKVADGWDFGALIAKEIRALIQN